MRFRTRVEALERRASPTGECGCPENRSPYMLFCRDPGVPAPPPKRCPRCSRPMPRVIVLRPPPVPGEMPSESPAYQRFDTLREFYEGTVRRVPAYEEIGHEGLVALICGKEPGDPP